MIYDTQRRINNFSYGLRNNLYDAMRDDFINRFYAVNEIHDQKIKETFEEAIHEMAFSIFKDIYEMCHLMGYNTAKPIIAKHIGIMIKTKNPTYPGVYEIEEE